MLKIIKLTILLLLTFLLVFTFLLFSGIKIDSFSFGNFSISQLYLKFDKKLILEIEDIVISTKESTSESSSDDIQKNIQKLPDILNFFQKIEVERLKIKDNEFTITLNDKHLYLDNKFVNISSDLKFAGSSVMLDVHSIYLKDTKLLLRGKSKVNIAKKVVNFFGSYNYKNVEGELNIQLTEDIFDFYINGTKSVKSIAFLKDFFRLGPIAEAWMYDNVTGDINLNYLYGKIDLNKKAAIMDSLKGQVVINDAKIRFHKDAKTVNTKKLTIDYEDDVLSFDLFNPVYNKSKIYGSKVYIPHLTSEKKGEVVVDLKTKSMLNKDILGILKAYDINLPLIQKSGKLDSSLVLKIPYSASRKMEVNGEFNVKNATLKLNNFEFFAKKAKVLLKGNNVIIKNSNMVHKKMLNANLDLNINTKTSKATGSALINSFKINSNEDSLVAIKGLKTKLDIDFAKNTLIDLKALKTKLNISKEKINIDIKDLKTVYPYSKLLQAIDVKKGDLNVDVIDENNISFKVNAKELNFPFEKNGKKISTLSANGTIKGNKTVIKTSDSDIEIELNDKKNTLLKLNNIDLVLSNNTEESNHTNKIPNIDLKLKNTVIKLDGKHFYKTSWANIHIKNSKINFEGEALDLDLPISRAGKKIKNLILYGTYENDKLDIKTKDKRLELKYDVPKEKISMRLNGYDVLYDTNSEEDKESKTSYYINGINSNIIMNEKYVVKATTYNFVFENYKTDIDLKYKNTKFLYNKDYLGNITVDAKNMDDKFLNSLINKNLIKGGNVNLTASGKNGVISGRADLKNTKIIDLAILNNLLLFINTSPGLINPLLAVPSLVGMATSGGFDLQGYKVIKGKVDFSYNFKNKYLNMNKIFTKGNGIDFDGFSTIDFKNSKVNSKLKLIFFKNYSKIVGAVPVLNYILLGDEKRVDTQVEIYGTLDKPKYKTKLAKDGVSAPVNLIKRIILSPVKLLEKIGGKDKEDKKNKE